jgi:glyoxylase-like metal-dependent hydrolase (beta-lactamase superfamily II)
MSTDCVDTMRTTMQRATVVTMFLVAGLLAAGALAPPLAATQPVPDGPRLYVFDCGYLINLSPETYNLSRTDVPDPTMSVPCFLVVHPGGTVIFDTGLGDKLVGRPPYLTRRGPSMSQVVLKTLSGQMADIGYAADGIKYLVLSHMHFDHVGNANDFAGAATTWLVQKVERDAMFGDQVPPQTINPDYAGLKNARTQLLNGDHDIFGDGTVVIKSTPGHTVGHQVLVVRLRHTGPVVLSGDLYHYPGERTLNRMPDREKTAGTPESRAAIEALVKQSGAQLWIGHDIANFARLKKSPEYYD